MAEQNLQEIHDFLFQLALQAGDMITAADPSHVDTKKNSSDLVTETDKVVEDMVSSSLRAKYPDYAFLGEETAPPSGAVPSGPVFIVDPIDGTTNFVHAHPYVSISLCFAIDQHPKIGIVYNPFTQQMYHAIRGRGAYLTAPSIPTSHPPLPSKSTTSAISSSSLPPSSGPQAPVADSPNAAPVIAAYTTTRLPLRSPPPPLQGLDKALVAIEWGNERHGHNFETKVETFTNLAGAPDASTSNEPTVSATAANPSEKPREGGGGRKRKMVHSLRSLGSAALNCCAVARGDLDAYWEGGCWAWDVGAGWVVVEEAGGRVVGGNPGEWDAEVDGRRYLVVRGSNSSTNEKDQQQFLEEFWDALPDGPEGKGGPLKY